MTRAASKRFASIVTAALMAVSLTPAAIAPAHAASQIEVVVNRQAITSVDIARRVAFLRLQRAGGNLKQKAREQLVNEALQMQEARRVGAVVADSQVEASYARFAESNNMSAAQLTKILNQAGVTPEHFKDFIRAQMTWPRLVRARFGGGQSSSTQDLVAKMLEEGGSKPSTTEYMLQQVILVVPQAKRSNAALNARKREAENLRNRVTGCAGTVDVVKGLRDVTVRDLGRVLQPQLPAEWKPAIEKTSEGRSTPPRVTERGVEFITICSAKTVSDDVAAAMVFEAENDDGTSDSDNAKQFLEELRSRAVISNR